MRTDELIAELSGGLEPVKRGTVTRLLAGAVVLGLAGSVLVMLGILGLRYDFNTAITSFGMWTKLVYTFAIAIFSFWLVERAGRPGAQMTRPLLLLALPLLAIVLLSVLQMSAPQADMPSLVLGHSSRVCAPLVLMTALPTLAATFWALKQLAPTRLRAAGAIAGLFAGGAGAFVYSFHCTEGAAPFIAIWYSLGILATTALGALLGPRLLRW
ncbi:MAG TPA: DUF1109 domain-containing protein [Rhizomicrobium sp.]|jgi:hypothetical protein|nr:DUF1109 domain-containing protein [Rhizomicrobium sp.]